MKKIIVALLLISTFVFSACTNAQNNDAKGTTSDSSTSKTDADDTNYDPYSVENRYDIPDSYFEKKSGVDYGTVQTDVTYYSTTAGDNKQCNILLPAGYDENQTYPVMYIFHGFGGSHSDQIDTDSYVTLLYGNMLNDGLTVPMILVNVDMYTDKQSDKENKTEEQLRYIYDKAIDDVAVDLMPYIEKNYPVRTGREYTAVAGMSEGGAKSLCTGFKWLDKFGYIAGFAPDTGVILTEYYIKALSGIRPCLRNFLSRQNKTRRIICIWRLAAKIRGISTVHSIIIRFSMKWALRIRQIWLTNMDMIINSGDSASIII